MKLRLVVAALLGCSVLVACTAPTEGRLFGVSSASVELQRNALLECRDRLGYAGQALPLDTQFRSLRYEENILRVRAVAGGAIDASAARQINDCAETALIARFGSQRPMVGPEDVIPYQGDSSITFVLNNPALAPTQDARVRLEAEASRKPNVVRSSGCPTDAPVIYGGTLYCLSR